MADIADQNDPARIAYLAEGNARQARKRVAAKALLYDSSGAVLLVDPTYKPHWDLPGGMAEANEAPRRAATRELHEELGLTISVGRVLLVDWVAPHGPWDDQLVFVFDGGTLDEGQRSRLDSRDPELRACRFASVTDAKDLLRPDVHDRLLRADHARATDGVAYSEFGS